MAARASLNVQSHHLKWKTKVSTMNMRQVMRGLNANKDGCEVSLTHTYLVSVNWSARCVLCAGVL